MLYKLFYSVHNKANTAIQCNAIAYTNISILSKSTVEINFRVHSPFNYYELDFN